MEAETETIETMEEALLAAIDNGMGTLTGASRERLPHAERAAETKVIPKHDAVLLMWTTKEMADLVKMSCNSDIGCLPAAAAVTAIIAYVFRVCARGIREGLIDLVETGRIALKAVGAEDGKLELTIASTERSVAADHLRRRIPMGVEEHGGDVLDLIALQVEVSLACIHRNVVKRALPLSVFVLLSIVHAPDFGHCLRETNDVNLGFGGHAVRVCGIAGKRLGLPLFVEAEGPITEAIAPHVLRSEGLPHVCCHPILSNCHCQVVPFKLDAARYCVVRLVGITRDKDSQLKRRRRILWNAVDEDGAGMGVH